METKSAESEAHFAVGALLKAEIALPFIFGFEDRSTSVLVLAVLWTILNQICESSYRHASSRKACVYSLLRGAVLLWVAALLVLGIAGSPYTFQHEGGTKLDVPKVAAFLKISMWLGLFLVFIRLIAYSADTIGKRPKT